MAGNTTDRRPVSALVWIERGFMAIAGTALLAVAVVTLVDVVLRYGFNSPLVWSFPVISNYLLVLMYFLAVSDTQRCRTNVAVDFVVRRASPVLRRGFELASLLSMLLCAGLIAYTGAELLIESIERKEILPGVIQWQRWPTYLPIVAGFLLLALRLLVDIARAASRPLGVDDPDRPTH